jgi:uncharacterized protein YcfL
MRRQSLLLVAGALLFASLTGCATVRQYPQVSVYGSDVIIDRVSEHETPGGVPRVVVAGRSRSSFDRRTRYRAQWSDAQGRPIKTVVSNWNEIVLQGRRPFELDLTGPGGDAAKYRFEIEVLE